MNCMINILFRTLTLIELNSNVFLITATTTLPMIDEDDFSLTLYYHKKWAGRLTLNKNVA